MKFSEIKNQYRYKDNQHNWNHILDIKKNVKLLKGKDKINEHLLDFLIHFHGLKDYMRKHKNKFPKGYYTSLLRSHKNPKTKEEKIVYDANMITNVGKVGVKKAIVYGKRIGRSKKDTYKYLRKKLKYVKFDTKIGNKLGKKRKKEMKSILSNS